MLKSPLCMAAVAGVGMCATLQQVADFGYNPTDIDMYVHVPEKLALRPSIVVALHGCFSPVENFYNATELPSYADTHGFVLIYPATTHMSSCWDVQNPNSLTHGAGGDAGGIVSMVQYALKKYNGNPRKVFVLGSSSGAMMTNVLVGSYPNVFEAAAAYSGTAHACFAGAESATPLSPNQTCAQGLQHTPKEWSNFVHNSYKGYKGKRPRVQIYHGLADGLVVPQCAVEALKQWSDVLDVKWTRNVTGVPASQYTQLIYGDGKKLQGFFGEGVGHVAPVQEKLMLEFFGILCKT